jgi:Cd2+/Zn2+-exporting ATPase
MGGNHLGTLMFSSYIKENAAETVADLRRNGVRRMALLSGDAESAVSEVAGSVGLSEYYAERMPAEKLQVFERICREQKEKSRGTVAFCGDGLNDSAVIAASDVGIAMGRGGSAVTVEAADLVLMDDSPKKIVTAMRLARRTVRIANQNIAVSLGLKIGIAVVCVAVLPSMELALIADVGAAVITVLNAMRAGKTNK